MSNPITLGNPALDAQVQAGSRELTTLQARAANFATIETAADYEAAGAFLVECRTFRKRIEGNFEEPKTLAYKAWKAITEAVARLTSPIERVEGQVDRSMRDFRRRQDEAAAAEARQRQQEQAAREKEERELAAMMAEEAGDTAAAAEILEAPSTAAPVAIAKTTYVPKVDGLTVRKVWKAEVTSLRDLARAVADGKVPEEALLGLTKDKDTGTIRSQFLDQRAREWKSMLSTNYAGVRAYEDEVTATSSRAD